MSTSLSLSPEEIIAVYALRFKIETSFDEQKNDMGCFGYHFWTAALPKRKRWRKSEVEEPTDERSQRRIVDAKQAIDSFVCLCTIGFPWEESLREVFGIQMLASSGVVEMVNPTKNTRNAN
jgi:hypothetical protein